MKTAIRLSIVALIFALCAFNRASAQTITGSGVIYNAGAPQTGITAQEMATWGANLSINATVTAGKANGTIVVDFAPGNYSGFVQSVTTSTVGGLQLATVTAVGYSTIDATGAKTAVKCVAVFGLVNGNRRAVNITFSNYATGAWMGTATFNLITGGVAIAVPTN